MDKESKNSHHREGLDSASKEWRRLHALHLKEIGWKQRDITIKPAQDMIQAK